MKYIVKMDDLKTFSSSFTNYCNKELLSSINSLENDFNKIDREGKNKDLYKDELLDKINYLKSNLDNLYFFAYFYKLVSERYTEANMLAIKEFDEIKKELLELEEKMENVL